MDKKRPWERGCPGTWTDEYYVPVSPTQNFVLKKGNHFDYRFPSLQSLSRSSSGISVLNGTPTCRICQTSRSADDINGQESLVSPCDCRGSLGFVHKSCMEKWLNLRNKDTCELCHFKFNTKRKFRPLHKVGIVFILASFVDRSV